MPEQRPARSCLINFHIVMREEMSNRDPTCHRTLTRYWFPLTPGLGIGVTEASRLEAGRLAEATRERFFPEGVLGEPVVNVDISTLDPVHVLPNMGPAVVRGVWFPQLNL